MSAVTVELSYTEFGFTIGHHLFLPWTKYKQFLRTERAKNKKCLKKSIIRVQA